jgi:4-hydroxy-4-methyl-2-oxoglutarate aldolase
MSNISELLIEKTITLIERNRISSTEVADALGKNGVIDGLLPINTGKHIAGKVHYVYAYDESNWSVHEQIQEIPEDCILYIDSFNCNNKAIFGDLVSKYLMLYKQAKGLVVNGFMRDIPDLRKYSFPIWCAGFTPLGCYNIDIKITPETSEKVVVNKKKFQDGILVCDDSGCTLIEHSLINEDTYKHLELIELQEDIWSFCINTLKWSTYETVCLKNYMKMPEVLPDVLKEKVKSIPFKK